ncbi:MAG: hypothetical protein JW850_03160, partial [Thermoflexales bacterium]|nr:hypothetical protein [Thermoflexales bacterium]
YLQNTGVAVATADIRFYDINGNCQHTLEDVSIAPNGQAAVNLAGIAQLGSFSGSAVVSADQALAVTVRQDNANGAGYSDYNAFSSGADTLYLPSLLKGYYNWNSAFQVQNVGDIAAHVTITYSNGLTRTLLLPVPAKGYAMVSQSTEAGLPNNWAGSAWLSTNNGQPIVAIVNQQNTATGRRSHQSYSALLGGAASLVAPFVANNLGGDGWKTGLQVQNVDSAAAQVQRSYYYAGGSAAVGGGTENIDPGACAVYAADGMPVGAELSASVVSLNGQRIGGICNLSRSSGAGDIGGSYNLPGH